MKNVYVFICFLFVCFSCKKEVEIRSIITNDSLFQTIVVDPDDISLKEPTNISVIADNIEYVPLQTADSILIGSLKKMIVWNNQYYIWDQLTESIFCFDSKGKFIFKLCNRGEGPEEYPRISNFTMDMENGNICIYSDMTRAIYIYTKDGEFLRRDTTPLILTSFAVRKNYSYFYLGRLPNNTFFNQTYPEQCRYVVTKNGELTHQQLPFTYNNEFLRIPLSFHNFTLYKDTMLLTEFLRPEVYAIDSAGILVSRYRIEFLTNTYTPSFETGADLNLMKSLEKEGKLTELFGNFFETDKYIFFNYSRGLVGSVYVDKVKNKIHNMGYFLLDDFNNNRLSPTSGFATEEYLYKIDEPASLLRRQKKGLFSSDLNKLVDEMNEFDNPVIVKIKLK